MHCESGAAPHARRSRALSARAFARVAALLFAGCTRPSPVAKGEQATLPPPSAPTAALAAPRAARAQWRVCTTGDYAPFSTREAGGQLQGFDIDVARALADDSGADLEWVSVRWPGLQAAMQAGQCDVAMTGVTWQPARSVVGYMTRAVARGGPCVLGDPRATPVGVNRGGVLEAWARTRWPEAQLVITEQNQSLPELLAGGRVRAIVTDSFELHSFARPGWASQCEPRAARKVYWVAPARELLAKTVEAWLESHGERLQAAQRRWFGETQPLRPIDHLSDLLARRMAFMPLVAGAKAQAGLPIEDLAREKLVLDAAIESARRAGLREAPVRDFFALQIELAKAVQRRKSEATTLDLGNQIRVALNDLGERILSALSDAKHAGQLRTASLADLEPLTPLLDAEERQQLLQKLRAIAD
jgi:cyclohexadienyl dehydratase